MVLNLQRPPTRPAAQLAVHRAERQRVRELEQIRRLLIEYFVDVLHMERSAACRASDAEMFSQYAEGL